MRVTVKGLILEDINKHGSVTVRDIASRHGCSEAAARKASAELRDAGLITVLRIDDTRQQHLGFPSSQRDVLRVFGAGGRNRLEVAASD